MTKQKKIMQLLGADKMATDKQKSIKSLLDNLVEDKTNIDPPSFERNMTQLLNELGAQKLSGDQRKDLTEKLCIIVEVSANKDVPLLLDGKVNPDFFHWTPNQQITLDRNYTDTSGGIYSKLYESYLKSAKSQSKGKKINKNDFCWGNDSNYNE